MDKPIKSTFYIDPEKYKKLKIKLINKGMSFTEWVNAKVDEEIKEDHSTPNSSEL